MITQVELSPEARFFAPEIDVTVTGEEEFELVPAPSWPFAPFPQHLTFPRAVRAQAKSVPALTETASEIPATLTGTNELFTVPLPSWPDVLDPQHQTEPSA